jgi:hypothetical protein
MWNGFAVPIGTTPQDLCTQLLPAWHEARVPARESGDFVLAVDWRQGQREVSTFELRVQGARLTASVAPRPFALVAGARVRVQLDLDAAAFFLADWAGAGSYRPRFEPAASAAGVITPTDPRLLKRLTLMQGTFCFALDGVPLPNGAGRVEARIALGPKAERALEPDARFDVTIETRDAFYRRLLEGGIAPEDALDHPEVKLKGSRMIAMQGAFALAPWLPSPKTAGARS